jgi:phosphotransferase family enzyme
MPAPLAIVRGLGRAYPFLKMPTRHGATGRWVFLVFRHGERDPAWVVKGTRDVRGVPALRAERDALRRVSSQVADTPLAARVPRLLGWDETESEACLVETFLAGDPLSGRFAPASAIGGALEWLVAFHEIAVPRSSLLRTDEVDAARAAAERLLPEELRASVRRELSELEGRRIPRGPVHGDFNPHNVHRDGDQFSVVDWEDSADDGVVSDDVFEYSAVAEFIERPVPREIETHALRRLGVTVDLERPLRVRFLLLALARDAARGSAAVSSEPTERWVRAIRREIGAAGEQCARV